jgi:two-component system chemotaxis sensor kinase CheA
MSREELIKKLMPTFVIELDGHIQDLTQHLINLEKEPTIAANNETLLLLQRTVHSLKGASRSVNLTLIESLCHKMEDLIALCLSHSFSPAVFQIFFDCVDALQTCSENLKSQTDAPQGPLVEANLALDSAIVAISTGSPVNKVRAVEAANQSIKSEKATGSPEMSSLATLENANTSEITQVEPLKATSVRVQADQLDQLMVDATEMLVENSQLSGHLQSLEDIRMQLNNQMQFIARKKRRASRARALASNIGSEQIEQTETFKLEKVIRELDQLIAAATTAHRQSGQTIQAINDGVQQLRLVSFDEACQALSRTVRDLAGSAGKTVSLEIIGGSVGIDRSIVEEMRAPLMHLVRNAIDHGIENDEVRAAAGKTDPAKITLAAVIHGSTLTVSVSDNGAGLNSAAIKEKALKLGIDQEKIERNIYDMVFLPGFSTARIITAVSGRGLGLDVVKSSIEKIGGQIEVSTEAGKGTTFTLDMPTTLTTARALLLSELGQTYALMVSSVSKVMRIDASDIKRVDGHDMIMIDGAMVRACSLRSIFGGDAALANGVKHQAILITADKTRLLLLTDKLLNEREIVLKPLSDRLRKLKLFIGTTLLDDGSVALILNAAELIRSSSTGRRLVAATKDSEGKKRIIVADDSLTTRSMEKSILEAAGYEVITASDGAQGWRVLQERGADLVVSDVEMPNMDGFAFAAAVRSSKTFSNLPFILVTALAKDSDRVRGIDAGASAYLVKSEFEEDNLLEVIKQFI